jgi:RNA polymerase sigma-70 factor (ECF subfamily)
MEKVASTDGSAELLARWQAGDQQAATKLWRRYAVRLIALVRSRLSSKLAGKVDPEDVVQSAYRSFFTAARDDRYVLRHSGDLWRLLVAIALHKLDHQLRRHWAGKRSVAVEQNFGGENDLFHLHIQRLAREPSPAEAVALADELEQVMRQLEPVQRRMVEMRLQGYHLDEIAGDTQRHERTVRRVLKRVEQSLRRRCSAYASG